MQLFCMDEQEAAWIGDAVLALVAREWLLGEGTHPRLSRTERFIALTSNEFLQGLGNPTRVEAQIGRIYSEGGLEAARAHIEATLLPLYRKQQAKLERGYRGAR
jgi:dsRNA-specific ribonuclease